jgi:D-alanyl-D-alanine carboxypeptidase
MRRGLVVLVVLAFALPASASTDRGAGFAWRIAPISAAQKRVMTGVSWRSGCPVGLSGLRSVWVSYLGFDRRRHLGHIIVNRSAAKDIVQVFRTLYRARYPIRRMVPVDAYGGNDFQSIEHDNTSSFNCRNATGSSNWSMHAYGLAIDLNPLENPYVSSGRTSHRGSVKYLNRSKRLKGMIHPGDVVVRAFESIGWGWGGYWTGSVQDLQHFSSNGH